MKFFNRLRKKKPAFHSNRVEEKRLHPESGKTVMLVTRYRCGVCDYITIAPVVEQKVKDVVKKGDEILKSTTIEIYYCPKCQAPIWEYTTYYERTK